MILITGATGFIGRRVVPLARKFFPSEEIVCLIKNNLNDWEKKGKKIINNSKVTIIEANLINRDDLKHIPKFPRIIIHLAAITDTSKSDYSCNDIGTENLYKSFGNLGPKTHVIYAGTAAIMAGRQNCSKPFDEMSKPFPTKEYGRSKLKAENFLIEKCKKDNFRLTIIRLTTVYSSDPRKDSLLDILEKLVLRQNPLARLNWPGLTGLIHVDDVAKGILILMRQPPTPKKPQIYIFNTETVTLNEINRVIHRKLRIKYNLIVLPKLFWRICSYLRCLIHLLERFLPPKIYNYFWRASLVVDNVICCDNKKFKKYIRIAKLRLFKDYL